MHAWIRSTLILVVMLGGISCAALAGDFPAPTAPANAAAQPVAPAPGAVNQPGGANQPDGNGMPASATPVDPATLDDEEAPDAAPAEQPQPADEQAAAGGPKTPTDKIVDKFMLLDIDGSKGVSMDEYLIMVQQRAKARFEAMDADGNGEVSEDEYRQFWKSRMAKWYRLKR